MNKLTYFCFLAVILGANSASAPFITPCKAGDNACYVASAQAAVPFIAVGIPELGIKSLDPMEFDVIKGDQGGLSLTFKDTAVTGMKGCNVDGVKHDLTKGKQSVTIRCTVELNGNYKLDGQLLVLPIKGEGKYKINIRDIVIKASTALSTVDGDDGKKHWNIDNWHFTHQTKTGATFKFENLFNGNKVLAGPVEDFVNTNWREVMHEIAPPIVHAIVARVVEAVSALYKAVPAEELFIA
ncbi:circadian clock-controlled protein daywake [Helicoverpa armigera]|uniref:circadian clock-controlled protein daywake n=1 Tax=Helicoverpa armigera TaxID=29058 RepID=UPI003082DEED